MHGKLALQGDVVNGRSVASESRVWKLDEDERWKTTIERITTKLYLRSWACVTLTSELQWHRRQMGQESCCIV